MHILIGLPLVTLAANTALFIHLSGRVDLFRAAMDARFDVVISKLAEIDNRVSVLEDRAKR